MVKEVINLKASEEEYLVWRVEREGRNIVVKI